MSYEMFFAMLQFASLIVSTFFVGCIFVAKQWRARNNNNPEVVRKLLRSRWYWVLLIICYSVFSGWYIYYLLVP